MCDKLVTVSNKKAMFPNDGPKDEYMLPTNYERKKMTRKRKIPFTFNTTTYSLDFGS